MSAMISRPVRARGDVRRLSACALAVGAVFAAPAQANPVGASVAAGQASVVSNGHLTTVTNSNGAIINWQSFSIGRDEITRFVQPSASSRVLNRVLGPDPSAILGRLESNGQVFLINPAGILVGAGARIDVGGFVASTLNLRNEDFLANRLNFDTSVGGGLLRNEGGITTVDGGRVYLVAPRVENAGTISAPRGEVLLAAGQSVQIGDTGLPGVRIAIPAEAGASNTGSIAAEAGRIGLFGALVRNSGRLSASSAVADGGRILLKASGTALVEGDGTLEATGNRGGRIEVLGDRVGLADRASLDASGASGGGIVLVGGGYQGRDAGVANASVTWMGGNTSIHADARETGDGGQVVVWADDTTRAYGTISARGGALGGNGGSIETSGKRFLDVEGIRVNASAPAGAAGNWLLDPEELRVVNNGNPGSDSNASGAPNFAPVSSASQAVVSSTTLQAAINSNSSVTLQTGSGGPLTGDITFDASLAPIVIAKTGNSFNSGLNVFAYRNIRFTGGTTTFRTTAGAGSSSFDVYLHAGNGNSVGPANLAIDAGSVVNLDATSTAAVGLHIGNGKTLTNSGTMNLGGNSTVYLPTQTDPFGNVTRPATLQNAGTFNNASSAGWFILSNSSQQDGVFDNTGIVNTVGGSVEGIWNNRPGAILNLLGANTLSLQNAQLMRGTINVAAASGTLWISEYHGTVANFQDTAGGGSGRILVAGGASPRADFRNFTGGGLTLEVGSGGTVTASAGDNVFGNLVLSGGAMTVSNATLSLAGNYTLQNAGLAFSGVSGLRAFGDLNIVNRTLSGATQLSVSAGGNLGISGSTINATQSVSLGAGDTINISVSTIGATATAGTSLLSGGGVNVLTSSLVGSSTTPMTVATGLLNVNGGTLLGKQTTVIANNLRVTGGGSLVGTDTLRAVVAQNVLVDASSGSSSIVGVKGVNLVLRSPDSVLALGTPAGAGTAAIKTGGVDASIDVFFANRASGGLFVDGVAGVGPGGFGSGFYSGLGGRSVTPLAVLGTNLFVRYGAVANDICKVLPGLCVVKPPVVLATPFAPKPPVKKDDDDGLGNFGDDRPKARRPGVCKAA